MNLFKSIVIFGLATVACSSKPDPLRVLVITGGHDFGQAEFFEIFRSQGIDYLEVSHPEANDWYGKPEIFRFDALVFYDMVQDIGDLQKQQLLSLTERGMGMVFLHHALVSYQEWDEFMRLLGGRYYLNTYQINGVELPASGYQHDEKLRIAIADRTHPVTEGVGDFEILDEVYSGYRVLDGVHVLLTTDHPMSSPVVGWANHRGSSRIVYLQPGHDRLAYENPNYRQLVANAIRWVSGN